MKKGFRIKHKSQSQASTSCRPIDAPAWWRGAARRGEEGKPGISFSVQKKPAALNQTHPQTAGYFLAPFMLPMSVEVHACVHLQHCYLISAIKTPNCGTGRDRGVKARTLAGRMRPLGGHPSFSFCEQFVVIIADWGPIGSHPSCSHTLAIWGCNRAGNSQGGDENLVWGPSTSLLVLVCSKKKQLILSATPNS